MTATRAGPASRLANGSSGTPRSGASPPRQGPGSGRRTVASKRPRPLPGHRRRRIPVRAGPRRGLGDAGRPWARPASSSWAAAGACAGRRRHGRDITDRGPPADEGGGAPASRSAALPARPWPSTDRPGRNSDPHGSLRHAARRAPAASPAAPAAPARPRAPAAPAAHGGGAAQSRGGFRRTGGSAGSRGGGGGPGRRRTGHPRCRRPGPRSVPSRPRSPAPRACAASRRAQSWKVGQTGNALDRQYASW